MVQRREPESRGRVGVKQVADEAGVSTATVSRVLSGTGYASEEMRSLVNRAAGRLGYQPNALARGLRRQKSTTLGILVPELTNPVTLSFIRGVQHVAESCGYAVAIGDAQRQAGIERRQLELMSSQRVAAVVVAGALQDPDSLSALGTDTPVIHSPAALARHSAGEDAAIQEAVNDLARHGHRRLLFVARAPLPDRRANNSHTGRRHLAVLAAAARHDMVVDHCSTPMDLSTAAVGQRLSRWVSTDGPDHALICASHRLAPQLLGTLSEMRLALPGDLSFISFGDSDWARAYRPGVAVIRFDRYREARRVTAELSGCLGSSPSPEEEPDAPEYVARGSVGVCPTE